MNDIDALMARIDEINRKDPPYSGDDIATIIAYHRHQRSRRAAGEKPAKPKTENLADILGTLVTKSKSSSGANPFKGKL
jgi:hypothetical protein